MNFFKLFKWSITEPKFYPLMSHTSLWRSVGYLLGLVLIMAGVFGYRANLDFQTRLQTISSSIKQELPDFELKNGKLKVEGNQPFVKDYDGFVIAIDTTGTKDESFLNAHPAGIFVNSEKLVSKQALEQRTFMFNELPEATFTKADVLKALPLMRWGFALIWPVLFILILLEKLISVYALSFFGIILQRINQINLKYRQMWNLSLFALTLPMLLDFWLSLMGWQFQGSDIIFWTLGMLYLWLGLAGFRRTDLMI